MNLYFMYPIVEQSMTNLVRVYLLLEFLRPHQLIISNHFYQKNLLNSQNVSTNLVIKLGRLKSVTIPFIV